MKIKTWLKTLIIVFAISVLVFIFGYLFCVFGQIFSEYGPTPKCIFYDIIHGYTDHNR